MEGCADKSVNSTFGTSFTQLDIAVACPCKPRLQGACHKSADIVTIVTTRLKDRPSNRPDAAIATSFVSWGIGNRTVFEFDGVHEGLK